MAIGQNLSVHSYTLVVTGPGSSLLGFFLPGISLIIPWYLPGVCLVRA